MTYTKYDIFDALPRKSTEGGEHLNCQECGFPSCVVFVMKVESGKTLLSECPYVNYELLNHSGQNQTVEVIGQSMGEKSNDSKKGQQPDEELNSDTVLAISTNNLFVEKLNALKSISEQLPMETNLPTVATDGGFFNWFDHKVTGEELNNLTENIQDRMIGQNKIIVKVFQEIAAIYEVFSALDKVYVQEILIAINTAFKAIEDVKDANERIGDHQKKISGVQQDIMQIITQQRQIIQVLKGFKEKLEKLKHLYDIDKMFDDVYVFQAKVEISEQVAAKQEVDLNHIADAQIQFSRKLEESNRLNRVVNEKLKRFSDAVEELKELSTNLEKAVSKSEEGQVTTQTAIVCIENKQRKLEMSFGAQQVDIEHISAVQQEFLNAVSDLKEADDQCNEKIAQTAQNLEQHFLELVQTSEKYRANYTEKCDSFEREVKKCEQDAQDFYSKFSATVEQIAAGTDQRYEMLQNELTVCKRENTLLSKHLKLTKIISYASLAVSIITTVLFVIGVLS